MLKGFYDLGYFYGEFDSLQDMKNFFDKRDFFAREATKFAGYIGVPDSSQLSGYKDVGEYDFSVIFFKIKMEYVNPSDFTEVDPKTFRKS